MLKKSKSEFEVFFFSFLLYHSVQLDYLLFALVNYSHDGLPLFILYRIGFISVCFSPCGCLYFMSRIVCQPFGFFLPFILPLLILWCSYFAAGVKMNVKTSVSCGFTLFCTTFFFYVFVCYKLSWFINPSRLFKGFCY